MRAYIEDFLKEVKKSNKSDEEKFREIANRLDFGAKIYFEESRKRSIGDWKTSDLKSIVKDDDFKMLISKIRGKDCLDVPIYEDCPIMNFSDYDEAEDFLVAYVINCWSGKHNGHSSREVAEDVVRNSVYVEVSDLIEKYNLPDGWRTFIIAYILNPKRIGKNLKIVDDLNKRISVEGVNNKSIFLRIDKGVSKKDLEVIGDVFQVFLNFDIPTELLSKNTESNLLVHQFDNSGENKKSYRELAKQEYSNEYEAETMNDPLMTKTMAHMKTTDRIAKKVRRAKNRNPEYRSDINNGQKIGKILSNEQK